MPQNNAKAAQNAVRSVKKKRSLKRPEHKNAAEQNNGGRTLAIDMSKPDLDAIITGLNTGTLENPQEAVNRVYALAVDAIANTFIEGIGGLCDDLVSSAHRAQNDNPFAPWLAKFLPSDKESLDSFKQIIADKIKSSKGAIVESIGNTVSFDTAQGTGSQLIQGSERIRQLFSDVASNASAARRLQGFKSHLSQDRLEEILDDIQIPKAEKTAKRLYPVIDMPAKYRFSFGAPTTESSAQVIKPADPDRTGTPAQADTASPGQSQEPIKSMIDPSPAPARSDAGNKTDKKVISTACRINDEPFEIPTETISARELLDAHSTITNAVTADISAVTAEITGVMQELALRITDAALNAYAKDNQIEIPTLSESLQDDPRFEHDGDLSNFIHDLESADDDETDDAAPIDNDELSRAFGILLDELGNE